MATAYARSLKLCTEMASCAKQIIKVGKLSSYEQMSRVKRSLTRFKSRWKKRHPDEMFPTEMMFCGWHKGKKKILVVIDEYVEFFEGLHTCVSTGSASEDAKSYIDMIVACGIISEHYNQCLRDAIVVSAIQDPYTGGYVLSGVLGRGGVVVNSLRTHVLRIMEMRYDMVEQHMQKRLFYVSEGLSYSSKNERKG